MKTPLPLSLALFALVVSAGCASSPGSRIAKNRAEFDGYPADVKAAISEGEVRVGFSPDQVRMALGAPDRVMTRTSETEVQEVWIYREKKGRVGVGLGVGFGGGPVGAGVGVGSGGRGFDDERMRVVFTAGRVAAVEQSER